MYICTTYMRQQPLEGSLFTDNLHKHHQATHAFLQVNDIVSSKMLGDVTRKS